MKQGFYLQSSSPVQHMMSGNPNYWWNNINPPPPRSPFCHSSSSSPNLFLQYPPTSSFSSLFYLNPSWVDNSNSVNQDQLPESLSQLLMGGLVGEEDKSSGMMNYFQEKRVEDWEEQQVLQQSPNDASVLDNHHRHHHHVKQEDSASSYSMYGRATSDHHALERATNKSAWTHHHHHAMIPSSPPKSCVTTSFSSSMLDFSNKKPVNKRQTPPDLSSECNSNATGGAQKKAKVQPSSTGQSNTFKVRKEKLGDRISALHQLVSPFGKTDTASVLLEAIGYIRFLQSQIEALSSPYMGSASGKMRHHQSESINGEPKNDLRSRGLCLVPVSCTLQVGSDNGADYWASAFGGGGLG
ncbi:transcription factor bHLH68-like isoform X2 [Rhodamnia argentea]|uniref:Transcription factor bHLH68-like isoform X2 n=1 Tax=Rhodamnia argentea TaxID=178133 RepID=A0A8B8P5M9_9MYRT|nr:transcription factor bHLH68-like isoform X2 [Rhodamnia argentea]